MWKKKKRGVFCIYTLRSRNELPCSILTRTIWEEEADLF
jgi:hypothetical protein